MQAARQVTRTTAQSGTGRAGVAQPARHKSLGQNILGIKIPIFRTWVRHRYAGGLSSSLDEPLPRGLKDLGTREPVKLTIAEHAYAETTARTIQGASKIGLRNPRELVPDGALCLLARAYLEMREQLRGLVPLTDPRDPMGVAVAKILQTLPEKPSLHAQLWQPLATLKLSSRARNALVDRGLCYLGELVQIDHTTLLRLKNFGKVSLREVELALSRHALLLGNPLDGWPGPRWECSAAYPYLTKVDPQLVPPKDIEAPQDPLLALYCRVMHEAVEALPEHGTYIVRHWDGMDGCWTDCTQEIPRAEALRLWAHRTANGTHRIARDLIDYYRIFPRETHVGWDGTGERGLSR